jgi:serine protease
MLRDLIDTLLIQRRLMLVTLQKFYPLLLVLMLTSCSGGGGKEESNPEPLSLGGSVSGLVGSLSLANNDNLPLIISADGSFEFPITLELGDLYSVEITATPPSQECAITNAAGQMGTENVTNVNVTCTTPRAPVSLSGSFTPAVLTQVDSDINSPSGAVNISNDEFSSAQALFNFATVNGFASKNGTQRFGFGDRFRSTPDANDVYSVTLQAKQSIRMQVVDYLTGGVFQGDLDLELYDADFNFIKGSNKTTEFEQIQVPTSGEYFIIVTAFSGTSKYVLSLDAVDPDAVVASAQPEMRSNEAIIKFSSQTSARRFSSTNTLVQISSAQENTPVLVNFADVQTKTAKLAQTMPPLLQALSTLNPDSFARRETLHQIKLMNLREDVLYAEPNYIRRKMRAPNDTYYNLQWHYPAINLPQAWDITTGTPSSGEVIVSVVDTGLFLSHPEFDGQLVSGYDFISDPDNAGDNDGIDDNPDDPGDSNLAGNSSWHGTHVAGTVAAKSNDNAGIAGVSWGAKIMPMRVLGLQGGTDFDITQAVLFSAGLANTSNTLPAQKADIINLSLGGPGFSQSTQDAFTAVRNAGVIIVAASGNDNNAELSYPASYTGVISVAATDFNGDRAPYSTFGTQVDVAAPGGDMSRDANNDGNPDGVLSAIVDDSSGTRKATLNFYQGTSMATPHMAGVLALMKAVHPSLSPSDVDALLAAGEITNEAGTVGRDDQFGHGSIDALKAVRAAQTLAAGGTPPAAPPLFLATPSSVNLGLQSEATITISNQGGLASVDSVSDNIDWLSVVATTVDANGLGSYTLTATRTSLSDSSYAGTITFNLSTGNTLEVRVSMVVGTNSIAGNVGTQFILLLNPITGESVDQATIVDGENGASSYQFSDVEAGTYLVVGGSDVDNDGFICQLGESCGGFPVLNSIADIVVADENISDLNFVVDLLSNLGLSSSNSLKLTEASNNDTSNNNTRPVGIAISTPLKKITSTKNINEEN